MSLLIPREPSSQALQLRAKLEASKPPPLDPVTIPRRRRIIQIAYEARILRAFARYQPTTRSIDVGGVPALEIVAPGGDAAGTILYFFGGGHLGGDPRQDMPISAALAAYSGMRVVAPSYRYAPENPFPAGLDDAEAVFRALMEETDGRLVVVGESAGANLVTGLMVRARRLGLGLPRAVVLLSPWVDLTEQGDPAIVEAGLDPTLNTGYLNIAAGLYAAGADRRQIDLSPLLADYDAQYPPTLITTAERDRLRGDSEAFAAKLRDAGVAVDLHVWPGLWHVFEFYDELPEAEASLRAIAAFISGALA